MGNVNMESYQIHDKEYENVSNHLAALDLAAGKAAVLPDLPTTEGKTVLTAVTDSQGDTELTYEAPEVEGEDIAPAFSEETAYSEGDLVYYDGLLYKFTADHTAGSWDPSEVTQTTVAAEFNQLKNTLTLLTDTVEISFPADATYVDSTMSVAKTGKSVIGVVGFNCSNYDMIPYALKITGQNLIYGIRSRTGSALGINSSCFVTILYKQLI